MTCIPKLKVIWPKNKSYGHQGDKIRYEILALLAQVTWWVSGPIYISKSILETQKGGQGGVVTPQKSILSMGGVGANFFFSRFFKKIEKNRKKIDFFFRSESHLGCSKCVLGAPKWLKTENGGVKCQNSSKNRVWGRKKVNFWPYGKSIFSTPDPIFWRILTFHTPNLGL